jgi:heat shock protein HtpX
LEFYERQEINRRRTVSLMVVHAAVFAALGLTVDAVFFGFPRSGPPVPLATTVALCISMTVSWLGYYRGDRTLLESLLARPLDESDDEHRQLGNVVREISLAAGVPPPAVYVIPDKAPNAMATGRDPEHAALAVTSGALALLDREETQGVIAHEIGHIASGDTAVMMMVGVLFGSAVILADWARRMLFFARVPTPLGVVLLVPAVLLSLVSPLLSRLMAMAVSRTREYNADATAVELTRNPTGLARALAKIARTRSPLRGATRGTAHMFIVNPLHRRVDERSSGWADLFATHPPLDHRIALLEGRTS